MNGIPQIVVSGSIAALTAAASAVDITQDEQAVLANLSREVARLREQAGLTLGEARAEEVRAIVRDVLADASARASLQGAAGTSGYNGGFFLSSADGAYSMKLNLLQQTRYAIDHQESVDNEQASGFQNKRTRLTFSGNAVDTTWTYKAAYYLAYSDSAEDFGAGQLSDAWIRKDFECGASLTVGQFRLPFSYEYELDVGDLQFMDYSTVDLFFGLGYGQGLRLDYESEAIRFAVATMNAAREVNAEWNSDMPEDQYAFTGRLEAKFAGNWGQFSHGQSWKGDGYGAKLGIGGYAFSENAAPGLDASGITADMSVSFGGGNLTASYYWSDLADTGDPDADAANPTGWVVWGGWFVADDLELVARWESASFDIDLGGAQDFSVLTVGGNWYLDRNRAKFSADFGYAFDAVSAIYAPYAIQNNLLEDAANDDGQWVVRAQLSFNF